VPHWTDLGQSRVERLWQQSRMAFQDFAEGGLRIANEVAGYTLVAHSLRPM
jgi:hypothetical protein